MNVNKTNIIIQIQKPLLLKAFNISPPAERETSFTPRCYSLVDPAREGSSCPINYRGGRAILLHSFHLLHTPFNDKGARDQISQDETEPEGKKFTTVMLTKCMIRPNVIIAYKRCFVT